MNNAANDQRQAVEDVTAESWDRSMALNLRAQFFAIQAVLPAMRAAGRGSIINIKPICWMIPSTGLPHYVAAKAAMVGLTRTLAHELGPANIRVNAVLPGAVATERQQRLWYTPEYQAEILRNQALKRSIEPADGTAGAFSGRGRLQRHHQPELRCGRGLGVEAFSEASPNGPVHAWNSAVDVVFRIGDAGGRRLRISMDRANANLRGSAVDGHDIFVVDLAASSAVVPIKGGSCST